MSQPSMFWKDRPLKPAPQPVVDSHISRPLDRLSLVVLEFVNSVPGVGGEFYMDELNDFIKHIGIKCAPDSPGRILRMLRRKGLVDYCVVNRAQSLYRVKEIL